MGVISPTDPAYTFLSTYWFNTKTGWWLPEQPIEGVVRHGMIRALELVRDAHLPLDIYHMCTGPHVKFIVCASNFQITAILLTPLPPTPMYVGPFPDQEPIWIAEHSSIEPGADDFSTPGSKAEFVVVKKLKTGPPMP